MVPESYYLTVSALLFSIGVAGVIIRRNPLVIFMSIELMLNAVNLAIVAFGAFSTIGRQVAADGTVTTSLNPNASDIALIVIAVAAAEATVGLAIVIAIYRNRKTPLVDEYDAMRQ